MNRGSVSVAKVLSHETLSIECLTPVNAFLRVTQGQAEACLFEKTDNETSQVRYSYIGVQPEEVLFIENRILKRRSREGVLHEIDGNPFLEIGSYLKKKKPSNDGDSSCFPGLAIGYIGYDAVQYLESIDQKEKLTVPPYEAYIMVFRTVIVFDHHSHKLSIYSDDPNELSRLRDLLKTPHESESFCDAFNMNATEIQTEEMISVLGKRNFMDAVRRIKEHIQKGDVFQCVISEQFRMDFDADPFLLYCALRKVSPTSYLFFLKTGQEALIGASPEMLLMAHGKKIETCPIAGTRPRGKTSAEDMEFEKELSEDAKEKAEHLMLVDLGRNDLGRVASPGTVHVPKFMKVQRYSHVMHLVSQVEGELDEEKSYWDAFASCFPAGTLTGAPKVRAMQVISDLEPICRGTYGGALIIDDFSGNFDSCILIRSAYCREGKAYIQAGAGIVADSVAEEEYQEVLRKTQAIRKSIACVQRKGAIQ